MKLRRFRQIFSAAVFMLMAVLFFDIYHFVNPVVRNFITSVQFVPALLSVFATGMILSMAGLVLIIALTFVTGRTYCSFLCPLGILQDLTARLNRKRSYSFMKEKKILRYGILGAVLLFTIAMGSVLLIWLDPYSLFGRFAGNILKTLIVAGNNSLASSLINSDIYVLYSARDVNAGIAVVLMSLIPVLLIAAVTFRYGRIYCNAICPVGTALSFVSRFSIFRISIDENSCIHCGKCESVCKSSCIDLEKVRVENSMCVSCFNCISVCPNGSISYKMSGREAEKNMEEADAGKGAPISRMSFLKSLVALPLMTMPLSARRNRNRGGGVSFIRKNPATPPGSGNSDRFHQYCTSCSLCITNCPTGVLQPSVFQYGLTGMMQPYMDYSSGYCNYRCTVCGSVCPTGAIEKLTSFEKKMTVIGRAHFIKENCVTFQQGTVCGACSEHCPTKAVYMVPFRDGLVIPKVNRDFCIGCGACENVCPARPVKAIYVEGERVHARAGEPEVKKIKERKSEDFPF